MDSYLHHTPVVRTPSALPPSNRLGHGVPSFTRSLVYIVVAAVVTLGASILPDWQTGNRVAVYQIECAPQSTSDDCAYVVGSVTTAIADTAESCSVSLPFCQTTYGTYGLHVTNKESIHHAGRDEDKPLLLVKKPGTQITSLYVRSTGQHSYIVWEERQNGADGSTKESVMFVFRRLANDERRWSKPDTLFETSDMRIRALDVAVEEAREHEGKASSAGLHVFISSTNSLGSAGTNQHWVLRGGNVSAEANINIGASAYSQIEIVGDSLHLAFVGLKATHTPERDGGVRSFDRNNVFLMSRHLNADEWGPIRIIEDTGAGLAHFLTASAQDGALKLGFITKYDTSKKKTYTEYRITGNTKTQTTRNLEEFMGIGVYIRMIRNEDGVIVEDRMPGYTILHRPGLHSTSLRPIKIDRKVLSPSFYISDNEPVYTYVTVCSTEGTLTCVETIKPLEDRHTLQD